MFFNSNDNCIRNRKINLNNYSNNSLNQNKNKLNMILIFIITLLILTLINYIIGITIIAPLDIRKWKGEWLPFGICEIFVILASFPISIGINQLLN